MLYIGICDDIPQQAEQFKKRLQNGNYTSQQLTIYLFNSAQELLESSVTLDLLFLDIEMPEMSGMELLKYHGTLFQNTKVIFLTSYTNYAIEGYQYQVYRFLPKQDLDDSVLLEVFETFEKENILNHSIDLFYQGKMTPVLLKDIMYIESENSYCNVTLPNTTLHCFMRLKDLIPLLPKEYFYQTHRAYIVNMKYIKHFNDKESYLVMNDGGRVYIARSKKQEFEEVHTMFMMSH